VNARKQMLVVLVSALAVVAVFFVLVFSPKTKEISKVRTQLAEAQAREQELRNSLAELEQVRRSAPATTAKLETIASYLPSGPDLPGFIRLMQTASGAAGIDLQSIAPSQPIALPGSTGIQSISVTVVVEGSFRRVEDLLARVENLARVVEVDSVALSPIVDAVTGVMTLQGTLSMKTFIVQPDATFSGGATDVPVAGTTPTATASESPGTVGGAQ
jgi:Tfp pilus assembly protein PilO